MEKITNLEELATYLKENISEEDLFSIENEDANADVNFQRGFESGYANSYANLLCILSPDYKAHFDVMLTKNGK